jgi:two-component sensor histidine kinase
MAEDSVVGPREVEIRVRGDLGDVSAVVATPLAVVIAELLQNAVEHGFPSGDADDPDDSTSESNNSESNNSESNNKVGHVELSLAHEKSALHIGVHDDGIGLPDGFDINATTSLGLAIVRDLVTSQLGGSIAMGGDSGTVVDISVGLDSAETANTW